MCRRFAIKPTKNPDAPILMLHLGIVGIPPKDDVNFQLWICSQNLKNSISESVAHSCFDQAVPLLTAQSSVCRRNFQICCWRTISWSPPNRMGTSSRRNTWLPDRGTRDLGRASAGTARGRDTVSSLCNTLLKSTSLCLVEAVV